MIGRLMKCLECHSRPILEEGRKGRHRVRCPSCGKKTGWVNTKAVAASRWNEVAKAYARGYHAAREDMEIYAATMPKSLAAHLTARYDDALLAFTPAAISQDEKATERR